MIKLNIIILVFLLSGCSNFINKFYKQIDQEDGNSKPVNYDKFDFYRGKERKTLSSLNNSNTLSSRNFNNFDPQTRRNYKNQRVKAEDLIDNENPGSLWIGRGQSNFLFARNNEKKPGDIVLIKVNQNLKDDITNELKRVFPKKIVPSENNAKDKSKTADNKNAEKPKDQEKETKSQNLNNDKIFDQISSIVVEELSKDHLIIKGRKQILFRGIKRLIEIKALIARRDILDDDSVTSKNILESQVRILR